MVLSNAERQARYRQRLKEAADMDTAYELKVLRKQTAQLEAAVNEVRRHVGLSEIQLVKPAKKAAD